MPTIPFEELYQYPVRLRRHAHPELERLMASCACDAALAALLVRDPEAALATYTPMYPFSAAEQATVLAIRDAQNIHEFASKLYDAIHQTPCPACNTSTSNE